MTKTRNYSLIIILNVIVSILFLLPLNKLDLLKENYSTLSLTTRGYLYVLIVGIIIGLLLAYETRKISNFIRAILMLVSMLVGVIIPHHIPYNLQGNLHLVFAYIGFAGLVTITLLNCRIKKLRDMYLLPLFISVLIYLKYGMVNTLSEVIVMLSSLLINLLCNIKYKR